MCVITYIITIQIQILSKKKNWICNLKDLSDLFEIDKCKNKTS